MGTRVDVQERSFQLTSDGVRVGLRGIRILLCCFVAASGAKYGNTCGRTRAIVPTHIRRRQSELCLRGIFIVLCCFVAVSGAKYGNTCGRTRAIVPTHIRRRQSELCLRGIFIVLCCFVAVSGAKYGNTCGRTRAIVPTHIRRRQSELCFEGYLSSSVVSLRQAERSMGTRVDVQERSFQLTSDGVRVSWAREGYLLSSVVSLR